jgi:hypothetical protein
MIIIWALLALVLAPVWGAGLSLAFVAGAFLGWVFA